MCLWLFLQLYFGLLVFVGYIVVDTQDIIEKAHFGDLDYVKHALTLFTDFVAVFIRILIIMVSWIFLLMFFKSSVTIVLFLFYVSGEQLKHASDKEEKKKKRKDWISR